MTHVAAPTAEDRRLESVQVLRGVAAMLVVFNHAGLLALSEKNPLGPSMLVPSRAVAEIGAIGVDLFFVISGFVMALSARRFADTREAGTFLALRFVRIAPLFYLACLLMLANLIRVREPIDPSSVMNSLTFIPVFDGATYSWPLHYLGWSLSFEFAFYLVVAALIASGRGTRTGLLLALLALVPLLGHAIQLQWAAWKVFTNPIQWEFALGVVAYLLWDRLWIRRLRIPFVIMAGMALTAILLALWDGPAWLSSSGVSLSIGNTSHADATVAGVTSVSRALQWGVPMFLCFCAVVGVVGKIDSRAGRLLELLGDASYSIYLSHLFLIMALKALVTRVSLHPDLVVVVALTAAPILGVMVYRTAEKPMLARGQGLVRERLSKAVPSAR